MRDARVDARRVPPHVLHDQRLVRYDDSGVHVVGQRVLLQMLDSRSGRFLSFILVDSFVKEPVRHSPGQAQLRCHVFHATFRQIICTTTLFVYRTK